MDWTVNDTIENEISHDESNMQNKHKKKLTRKKSIFSRTHAQKVEHIEKFYMEIDDKNDYSPGSNRNLNDKNEMNTNGLRNNCMIEENQ